MTNVGCLIYDGLIGRWVDGSKGRWVDWSIGRLVDWSMGRWVDGGGLIFCLLLEQVTTRDFYNYTG